MAWASRTANGNSPQGSSGEEAFREYVASRGTALLKTALILTGNQADAEDLVQAALAKTYLAWDKINDRGALDGYVRRAMVNTHISWWRQRRLDEYPTDELPDQAVADHASDSDMAEIVRRALARLPMRMRAAVMLRYFEDMTEPEIAAVLGISLGTVKSTVSRAVAKLRVDAELAGNSRDLPLWATVAVVALSGNAVVALSGAYCRYRVTLPSCGARSAVLMVRLLREVRAVRSTMMEYPLTVTSIMRYGTSVFGDREVVTCAGAAPVRRRTYAQAGRRAARLANALRRLGVVGDQRVGTFMWNNAEHLEAYLAVPSMGAVLHTLNIRLDPADVGYIASHAEDHAVIVDACLVPRFAEVLPHAPADQARDRRRRPGGDRGVDRLSGLGVRLSGSGGGRSGPAVHGYEDLIGAEVDAFDWPGIDEHSAAAMCYTSGTTGKPKGVVYSHRSTYLHSMAPCLGNGFGSVRAGPAAARGADVPRQRMGSGVCQRHGGRRADHAGPVYAARAAGQADRRRAGDHIGRGSHGLDRRPGAHADGGR